ncbi:MAG: PEP-CTERM sorting domain-containing protein [Cyanobacteria bacterium J06626_18]
MEPTPEPTSVPEPGAAVALVLAASGLYTLKRKAYVALAAAN